MAETLDLRMLKHLALDATWSPRAGDEALEYTVPLAERPRTLSGLVLAFNLTLWRPLLSRDLPIEQRHLVIIPTWANIAHAMGMVYDAIVGHDPMAHKALCNEILPILTELYKLCQAPAWAQDATVLKELAATAG